MDLELFLSPSISIPRKFLLKNLTDYTYRSSFIKESGRDCNGKDIKGSKYIIKVIDKLSQRDSKSES